MTPAEDEPLFEVAGEGVFVPTVYTRGPWDPGLLHGGPVAALFSEVLQGRSAEGTQPVRLTVDLMRPVPLAPLTMSASVVRTGRRLQLLEATLAASGKPCARATLLMLTPAPLDDTGLNPPLAPPADTPDDDVDPGWAPPATTQSFVGGAMDFRFTQQRSLGHGVGWLRLRRPVLPGLEISPLARAAAAADVGNAVSARRDPSLRRISFINADLSLSLSRLPDGDWIRLESAGRWEATGIGWVTSMMSDRFGSVGAVSNALVLA